MNIDSVQSLIQNFKSDVIDDFTNIILENARYIDDKIKIKINQKQVKDEDIFVSGVFLFAKGEYIKKLTDKVPQSATFGLVETTSSSFLFQGRTDSEDDKYMRLSIGAENQQFFDDLMNYVFS